MMVRWDGDEKEVGWWDNDGEVGILIMENDGEVGW